MSVINPPHRFASTDTYARERIHKAALPAHVVDVVGELLSIPDMLPIFTAVPSRYS
jgi:hypothetical protein